METAEIRYPSFLEPLVGFEPTTPRLGGWASYLHRAATTNYLCYVPVLEDSKGAGRARLTRIAGAKVTIKFKKRSIHRLYAENLTYFLIFTAIPMTFRIPHDT